MASIAVIGDWHNAWVTAACLASLGHRITLVSRSTKLDFHEPHLDELVRLSNFRRVHPEQYVDANVPGSDYAWIAHDTPMDAAGPNAEPVRLAAVQARIRCDKIIVSSQVPLGFCKRLEQNLLRPVAYVPENMRLKSGVDTFLRPDRLVIGATDKAYAMEVAWLLNPRDGGAGILVEPMFVDLATAEMVKHATNAFLATSISLANELAAIGQRFDVNMEAVAQAMRADSRIGPKAYVWSGPGFAGGTLERDLRALQLAGQTRIIDAVLDVNAELPHPYSPSCRCQTCCEELT